MRFLDDTNVMLDFAYFGVYYNPEPLDLTQYPQVHSVAFSLSKVFCTGFLHMYKIKKGICNFLVH